MSMLRKSLGIGFLLTGLSLLVPPVISDSLVAFQGFHNSVQYLGNSLFTVELLNNSDPPQERIYTVDDMGPICPAVMPSIDVIKLGYPIPFIVHSEGSGGGCDGHVDRLDLSISGIIINVMFYALAYYAVSVGLDKLNARKSGKTPR